MKKLFTAILFLTTLIVFGQTQSQYDQYKGTASGTDSYSVTITPATFPLYDGERVTVTYTVTNTGASTLRLAQSASTYSTSAIRLNNSVLVAGDIPINTPMTMTYVKASNTWSMSRAASTPDLTDTYVGFGSSANKLTGSSSMVYLTFPTGNVLSLTNTVTTGASVVAVGNGSAAFNLGYLSGSYAGNYTGTSVARASTSNIITTSYAPIMTQALPFYISPSTTGSDHAYRFDATGLKIGLNSTIHTGPSQSLEINGGSGTTLKIVDGNQALGRVLVSTATGVASWADYRTLLSADGNQKVYVDNDYAGIICGYNTFPTSASITLNAISGAIVSTATSHYWLSPGGNDYYFGNTSPATAHGIFDFGSIASSNKTFTWPNTSGTVALVEYKEYVALITQSGTSAPTASVLKNTLGGTLVWSYTGVGFYEATLTGAFPDVDKVSIQWSNGVFDTQTAIYWGSANTVDIETSTLAAAATNNHMNRMSLIIRVYP